MRTICKGSSGGGVFGRGSGRKRKKQLVPLLVVVVLPLKLVVLMMVSLVTVPIVRMRMKDHTVVPFMTILAMAVVRHGGSQVGMVVWVIMI
jgi:hypothetical protein